MKEFWVVVTETFSIEFIEAIVHKCAKTRCSRNIGGTFKKNPTPKLELRRFRDLINFGLHCSLSVSSILLYFISIRARVGNLHVKNGCNNELFLQN